MHAKEKDETIPFEIIDDDPEDKPYRVNLILIALVICFSLIYQFAFVQGMSMHPALDDGDYLICYKVNKISDIKRGNIIILVKTTHKNVNMCFVKRVIALEGDSLEIKNDRVYVNNVLINENYLFKNTITEANGFDGKVIIPKGNIFVMGDNREHSADSRVFGYVSENEFRSVALFNFKSLKYIVTSINNVLYLAFFQHIN